jgi:hypothetical protein
MPKKLAIFQIAFAISQKKLKKQQPKLFRWQTINQNLTADTQARFNVWVGKQRITASHGAMRAEM